MDLAKLMPKFEKPKNVFDAVAKVSDGVKAAKEFALDCKRVKEFILAQNSEADKAFEAANPVPPAEAPDWIQIHYYGSRCLALSLELIAKTGEMAKMEFTTESEGN